MRSRSPSALAECECPSGFSWPPGAVPEERRGDYKVDSRHRVRDRDTEEDRRSGERDETATVGEQDFKPCAR